MNFIIFKFAFRNIFLHKMKTFIVGTILIFGSFIAVIGNSIVDAIATGMKHSITQSVTGDIQIYSANAKEKLSVFGNMDGSPSDVGYVTDFSKVKSHLEKIPSIKAIVPMGGNYAMVNPGNVIDVQVEKLRKLYKKDPPQQLEIDAGKAHLKFLVEDLNDGVKSNRAEVLLSSTTEINQAKEHLQEVLVPTFWQNFDKNYEAKLEFVANKVAPLIFDDNLLYFNYLGTNLQEFKNNFPQFEIVKGQMVPEGTRGFLIHDYIYETFVKNRVARRLDAMKKEMEENQSTLRDSKELQDQVKANKEQLSDLYLTMEFSQRETIKAQLQKFLSSSELDLRKLLEIFFDLTDQNFRERYRFFYDHIAPAIQLYKIGVGEVIPLTAMTKLGSSAAISVKVWGTFRFKSFENSPLAGNFSLIDLTSFRELYGFMTESRRKQNKEIEAEMGVSDISKNDIESIFGETPSPAPTPSDSPSPVNTPKPAITSEQTQDVFINAAIFLKDPNEIPQTLEAINAVNQKEHLGLQAVDWLSASGIVGQMTLALRLILFSFVFILFGIAALMIMNSLLMATMERQQEIGTMRAIGAPKSFLYKVFLIETALTSLLFGGLGTLGALILIFTVGRNGIPAQGDVAKFFFSGPKLYFGVHWDQILIVLAIILFISFLATQYPAWRAMKISPLRAMQNKD